MEFIVRLTLAAVVASLFGWWLAGVAPGNMGAVLSFIGGGTIGLVAFIGYEVEP